MKKDPLPRLDSSPRWRERLLPSCRLRPGEVWQDDQRRHRVGCLDATDAAQTRGLVGVEHASLAIQDPPYNLAAFLRRSIAEYVEWCRGWVGLTLESLGADASLYVWLGADQNDGFQPLADFMILMRSFPTVTPRSLITMRNQRGYGTQSNWMAVRQELLYYVKGHPSFHTQYTDIPKILRGYYKTVDGQRTENLQRSRADTIRPGNVWVDVQQVFYRLQENVSGCYAQKPLKAIERIVLASSDPGDLVIDFFSHSGTTLLACERLGRRCFTMDSDPIFCEMTIRRLEHYRNTGQLGWQHSNAFSRELDAVPDEPQRQATSSPTSSAAVAPPLPSPPAWAAAGSAATATPTPSPSPPPVSSAPPSPAALPSSTKRPPADMECGGSFAALARRGAALESNDSPSLWLAAEQLIFRCLTCRRAGAMMEAGGRVLP